LRRPDIVRLIDRAVRLFGEARSSRRAVSVSEVAGRFSRGRGRGAEAGRRFHSRIWSLDPYAAAYEEVWACPLPLAWRFRFGWLYGVADQVVFEHGVPVAVIEYKSYEGARRAERVQAALYGLLVELLFCTRPRAYLLTPEGRKEVHGWEDLALLALKTIHASTQTLTTFPTKSQGSFHST